MEVIKNWKQDQPTTCLSEHGGKGKVQLQTIRNLSARKGWVVLQNAPTVFTPGKEPVLFALEDGWASGPVWKGKENFSPTGI